MALLDLSRATARAPLGQTAEGLSGASFESLVIDGERYVLKNLGRDTDWVMRAAGDVGVPFVEKLFRSGAFDRLAGVIDTGLVDVGHDPESGATQLLMHDLTPLFLRDHNPITLAQQEQVLGAMAGMHALTWGVSDTWGLTAPGRRFQLLSPGFARSESARGPVVGVPSVLERMWEEFGAAAPYEHALLLSLTEDPAPLVRALGRTPSCLVHGDWKGGNLGLHEDGRVVLVDWAFPGVDAPLLDLAWYLAVNCDRLPCSKEDTIAGYRAALEGRGVDTSGWWDTQLPLALLGGAVQMAWNKCGQPEELGWWLARVREAEPLL